MWMNIALNPRENHKFCIPFTKLKTIDNLKLEKCSHSSLMTTKSVNYTQMIIFMIPVFIF